MRRLDVRPLALAGLVLALAGSGGPVTGPAGRTGAGTPATGSGRERAAYTALQGTALAFLPDGDGSRFLARGLGYDVAVSSDEVVVAGAGSRSPVRVRLEGARTGVAATTEEPLPGRTNLLLGDDPGRWRVGVPAFGRVSYAGVWDGVDVVYRGQGHRLEYDFVVGAGVDPATVELSFPGTSDVRLTDGGDLALALAGGEVRMARPVLYQESGGSRRAVAGSFDLRPGGRVGFSVGPSDPALPVVIDPVVLDSTYLGGGGSDIAHAVAVDGDGNVYVAGSTESPDFPVEGPLQPSLAASSDVRTDAFVAKLNPSGDGFVYSTFLGGQGRDTAYGIAVGPDGSAYVTGDTDSSDFPMARPAQRTPGGGTDGFVAKLAPQGAVLQYSTFLGGGAADLARGVAVDQSGSAFVVGSTQSANFPVAGAPLKGAQSRPDDADAFVTRIDPSGSALTWSTYLGGSAEDHAVAVAVDQQGHTYVTGDTRSTDFPTARPIQSAMASPEPGPNGVPPDAFVSKLDPGGSSLVYSTYLGGSEADQATDIAVDGGDNAYVTGRTGSTNFPVAGTPPPAKGGDFDAFVAKVNAEGSGLAYSTFFGGNRADGGASVTVDGDGRASITGATASSDLRTVDAFQAARSGGNLDGFVVTFDPAGVRPLLASYLGAEGDDQGVAVAAGRGGALVVAGYTTSADFPTESPLQASKGGGTGDAFVTRIGDAPPGRSDDTSFLPSRERRIQILVGSTVALFVAAGLQTLWLRRRPPEVPDPTPAGIGAAGLAVTRPGPQAEWRAAATPAVRPTAFPNLGARPKRAPAPPLKRRRPVRVEGDDRPPPEELAVPDLLSDAGRRPAAVAPPVKDALPDEIDMWSPSEAEPPRPHVGADPGDGRAGTGEFDLLDPTLWGKPESEPEPDIAPDPTWWEFLVDDSEAEDSSQPQPGRPPAVLAAEPPELPEPPPAPEPLEPLEPPPTPAAEPLEPQPPSAAEPPEPQPPSAAEPPPPPAEPPEPGPPVPEPASASATVAPPPARPTPPTARPPVPERPVAKPDAVAPPDAPEAPASPPPVTVPRPSPPPPPPPPAARPGAVEPDPARSQPTEPAVADDRTEADASAEPPAEPATDAAADDWVADLWAAGESAPSGPSPAAGEAQSPDAGVTPAPDGELSVSDLLGEDLPIPDGPGRKGGELSVRALIDEDLAIPERPDPPAAGEPPPTGAEQSADEAPPTTADQAAPDQSPPDESPPDKAPPTTADPPAAGESPANESPAGEPAADEPDRPPRPLPEAAPGGQRRPWGRWTPGR